MKKLYYPGAGWDNDFINHEAFQDYELVICHDMLPNTPHYKPGQLGWEYTKTPAVFRQSLIDAFGPIIEEIPDKLYVFDTVRKNGTTVRVEYHINFDFNEISPDDGDVLIRGAEPNWIIPENFTTFIACDTGTGRDGESICFGECDDMSGGPCTIRLDELKNEIYNAIVAIAYTKSAADNVYKMIIEYESLITKGYLESQEILMELLDSK